MNRSKKSIVLILSFMLALVWQKQALSMNYLKQAYGKAHAYISNQWHGTTAEELQLLHTDIRPEILKQEKMQEILLLRHIKRELKRFKRSLETKEKEKENNEINNEQEVDPQIIWKSFFEFTLPNLRRLSKREKETITNNFCLCNSDEEHKRQLCKNIKPNERVKSTLELIEYLITIIKQQLTPDFRFSQKELDDCKEAQELITLISTKHPNAKIKGKLKICILMLSTFWAARASIYHMLYGTSLTSIYNTIIQTLWSVPNLATGMYLPLLIPVLFIILKKV